MLHVHEQLGHFMLTDATEHTRHIQLPVLYLGRTFSQPENCYTPAMYFIRLFFKLLLCNVHTVHGLT